MHAAKNDSPGGPFYKKKLTANQVIKMSSAFFPDVTLAWRAATFIDGDEIPVAEFLNAASKFLPIFGTLLCASEAMVKATSDIPCAPDRLGAVFSPVKGDIGGNISKLQKASSQYPDKRTIQKLVLAEKQAGKQKDSNGASLALLWFAR